MAVPEQLTIAARSIGGIERVEVLGAWTPIAGKWLLKIRVRRGSSDTRFMPQQVELVLLADPIYPWGDVRVYPAKEGGFTVTFPHQLYNHEGPPDVPWRRGEICVAATTGRLRRQGYSPESGEPFTPERRLRWVVLRLIDWLSAADDNELVGSDDPFELPEFPLTAYEQPKVVFSESESSLKVWNNIREGIGLVEFFDFVAPPGVQVINCFSNSSGAELFKPEWGAGIRQEAGSTDTGLWIRLKQVPYLEPYQAPFTWGELREACARDGVDLDNLLRSLLPAVKAGIDHVLLLGFPIPKKQGGSSEMMHWQPIMLPGIPPGPLNVPGFRKNSSEVRWQVMRTKLLANDQAIRWLPSENWHKKTISLRGRLNDSIQKEKVLIIGTGALGAAIAELLVRGGVEHITLMDSDNLRQGNLIRHNLTMREVGMNKASATANWLNSLNPHTNTIAVTSKFPAEDAFSNVDVNSHTIIIDASADDTTIRELGAYKWKGTKLFFSVSLTYMARRLLFLGICGPSFPDARFRELVAPWLEEDRKKFSPDDLPMEGLGCWHPIFPARVDDIRLMASTATKYLEELIELRPSDLKLAVAEQGTENGKFLYLRRIYSDW